MNDAVWLREMLGGRPISDIVECEAASIDVNAWFVKLTMRGGVVHQVAVSSQEEAEALVEKIATWKADPAAFAQAEKEKSTEEPFISWRGISWLVFFALLLGLAFKSINGYWLVSGMCLTSHFFSGMFLALLVWILFVATYRPSMLFEIGTFLAASPFLILIAAALTMAGKTVNATVGEQTELRIEGPITDLQNMTIETPGSRGGSGVKIDQVTMTVQDRASGVSYEIDLPRWVADREGPALGTLWHDRFTRGSLGWLYRTGGAWDDQLPKEDRGIGPHP